MVGQEKNGDITLEFAARVLVHCRRETRIYSLAVRLIRQDICSVTRHEGFGFATTAPLDVSSMPDNGFAKMHCYTWWKHSVRWRRCIQAEVDAAMWGAESGARQLWSSRHDIFPCIVNTQNHAEFHLSCRWSP